MSKSLGLGIFLGLCFTALIFGQAFAGDLGDKKRIITPADGLAKAFKAADRMAAIEKGSSKVSGITASSKNTKASSKLTGKKSSGKKFASTKSKSSKKSSLHKSKYAKKNILL